LQHWVAEQVYIALGFLLTGCALLHIDACPIEAYDKAKFDKILSLKKWGIKSQVAVAIGYRAESDQYAREKKVRWNKEDIVITI
jgi:nitroreductase / dihydropteridine reductase